MDLTLAVLLLFGIGLVGFILYSQIRSLRKEPDTKKDEILMEWLKTMREEVKGSIDKNSQTLEQQLKAQRETLDKQLSDQRQEVTKQSGMMMQNLTQQLQNSQEVIGRVQKQLGGIEEFGKDIKDLSNVLKSPKLRGGLGEQILYDILANTLPHDLFRTQFKFKNGETCDAVILTEKGLIPIDSKFPMENFKAMVTLETEVDREKARKMFISDGKRRVDEIASKYIIPEEQTPEQAVMYIPSETVFYEVIVNMPTVEEYCKHKN